MTFIHTSLLYWALPAGLIPIVIYYLMRFRSLKVGWGANYVLEIAIEQMRKKFYWEQVVLLALRAAACILLVLLFARPTSTGDGVTASDTGIHRVIVLDAAYGMLAADPGQPARWDRARQTLRQLIATWGRGERWSLVVLEDPVRWVVEDAAIDRTERALAALDDLAIHETRTPMPRALAEVAERMGEQPMELYIAAGDHAPAWEGIDRFEWPGGEAPPTYWIHPPLENRQNLAVTSLALATERIPQGHAVRAFTQLKNFGVDRARDVELEILVDGEHAARERVSLLPGQETTRTLDITFDEPGARHVTARLGPDALDYDNTFHAGAEVSETLDLLVLRDPGREGKFDSAWGFLEVFERVQSMNEGEADPVFTMGPLQFTLDQSMASDVALETFDLVLLDGGQPLSPQLVQRLMGYVQSGGGLLLAAGESVDAEAWNRMLGAAELLPARLGERHVEPIGGDRFRSLSRTGFDHRPLRRFEETEDGDLAAARFYTWHELEPEEGAAVLARYDDQTPFAAVRRVGLGKSLLLGSGLSGRGNNLPVREFFPPLIFRLAAEAASGPSGPRVLPPGVPITLPLDHPERIRAITFDPPGHQEPAVLEPERRYGRAVVTARQGAARSGLASMLLVGEGQTANRRVAFGIQGERVDSDLRPMPETQRAALETVLDPVEVADWDALERALAGTRGGREWSHAFALAALLVLLGEMLMQLRFVSQRSR